MIIIFWRGLGLLVLFFTFGFALAANLLANRFGGAGYWDGHGWPLAVALGTAGALSWVVGRRINKPAHKDANPRRPWTHDFFFLRVEWWAFPLVAFAVGVLVTGYKPGDSARTVKAATERAETLAPGSK